jgi:hypothetical protein
MGEEHFAELTVANIRKRRREYADDSRAICGRREYRRLGEEEIAEEDDGTGRENAVERRTPPPHIGSIDGVVVNQRSGMEKLDPRTSGYQVFLIIPVGATGKEQNQGSQPLPARTDQTEDEIGHTWIIYSHGFFKPRLHQRQFRSHGGEDVARPDINHRPLRTDRTPDLILAAHLVPNPGL